MSIASELLAPGDVQHRVAVSEGHVEDAKDLLRSATMNAIEAAPRVVGCNGCLVLEACKQGRSSVMLASATVHAGLCKCDSPPWYRLTVMAMMAKEILQAGTHAEAGPGIVCYLARGVQQAAVP